MKQILVAVMLAGSMVSAAHAEPTVTGEVAYPKGSIGYEALMRGDNERAVSQIMKSERVSMRDPAKLLNLGRAYVRLGRTDEAAAMFMAAMQTRDSVELVLADGTIMNSKEAARMAYAGLPQRLATR
jgi:Flp pilus assembly protein TadD